jgi:excisionase family DNA binding protein
MLMTSDELAQYLRSKKSTIYKMTCAKQIPYLKVGGLLRFDQKQIDAWLEKLKVMPISAA